MPTMKRPSTIRKRCETRPHSVQPTPQTADMRFTACFFEPLSAKKEKGNTNTVMPNNTAEPATPTCESESPRSFCMAGKTAVIPSLAAKSNRKSM